MKPLYEFGQQVRVVRNDASKRAVPTWSERGASTGIHSTGTTPRD
jgi:hypothetical protein